ncbi:iron-siderophore ABC transporter substrate-binding protein [Brevibacillus marinus]|uniref:ABC transporter substrate-binding protein n=1 Tax=Brevibacillus marinus TaxID=2496837 RepID=UPI000F836C54|nr:iron-siderophore ABC transporter substrate-binding protein [Brevibacillus marinus]
MLTDPRKISVSLLLCALVMLLTACHGVSQTAAPPAENETNAPAKAEFAPRTIQHLMGETVIQSKPEKMAVLIPSMSDFLLSVNETPHAAVSAGPNNKEFSWYLQDRMSNTINLGWLVNATNLEAIVDANPDLILANNAFAKVYEQLSKIAPTIIIEPAETEDGSKDWRQTFLMTAEIVGKENEAKQVIAAYDEKAKQARDTIAKAIGEETVMFLRVTDKELRYYGAKNFGVLYQDLALHKPAHFPDNSATFQPLSMEVLPEINPDHIFLLTESPDKLAEIQKTSVWNSLTAVQKNQVYPVDYDLWFQGFGPIANQLIIEEAVEKLTK